MDIGKMVIPAAGIGTRFLPYTKSIPKEMLPILNKPAIQYIIEEGIESDVRNFLIVTNRSKDSIADHFDADHDLEAILKEREQSQLLAGTKRLARLASYAYIRQPEPLGLGHALLLIQNYIGKEYFNVALPDDLIDSTEPAIKQLIRISRQEKGSVLAVQEIPSSELGKNTVISIKKNISQQLFQINGLVRQPQPKDAPSLLAVVGRFVLSHKIFPALEYLNAHSDENELSLHEAITHMAFSGERVFAYKIPENRYHLDTPASWLSANIGYGLKNPQFAPQIKAMLAQLNEDPMMPFTENRAAALHPPA